MRSRLLPHPALGVEEVCLIGGKMLKPLHINFPLSIFSPGAGALNFGGREARGGKNEYKDA
jgi:hypothetical protein